MNNDGFVGTSYGKIDMGHKATFQYFNISIFQRFNILAFCYVYHFQEKSAYHRFLNNTSAHTHVFRHD